jgi:hypothetical protein
MAKTCLGAAHMAYLCEIRLNDKIQLHDKNCSGQRRWNWTRNNGRSPERFQCSLITLNINGGYG